MQILLAKPRGFCAGVDRAVAIVERALERLGAPIYVRHEVVHNRFVVDDLRARGAIFVDEVDEVPDGATVIFSAHGVAPSVRAAAEARGLAIFDATCPLVTKVHIEVQRYSRRGEECVMIGHRGHPEVEGTLGHYQHADARIYLVETEEDVANLQVCRPDHLHYVTQTTLSLEDTTHIIAALRARFPQIAGPKQEDICYATQNRQEAVARLAQHSDVLIVVGSPNSSNSNRLREVGERLGCTAYLVDDAAGLQRDWVAQARCVGVTAGASAPEILVQGVIAQLQAWGGGVPEELGGVTENIYFALPKGLRDA